MTDEEREAQRQSFAYGQAMPETAFITGMSVAVDQQRAGVWPPLKKALWDVVMAEEINANYVKAFPFVEKLYHAAQSVPPVPAGVVEALQGARKELWDEWHSHMSEADFNADPTIVDIDKALQALARGCDGEK